MPQEYEILDFKAGDYKDNYGNFWCHAALAGVGEPVAMVVKDPTKFSTGQKVYGVVEEKTSKAGKPYLRFTRKERADNEGGDNQSGSQKREWQPRDDAAIQAQWAIGQAVQLTIANGKLDIETIEADAKRFFEMIERVKNSITTNQEKSGYEKAKEVANTLRGKVDEIFDVTDQPINLDDIPF